MNQAAQDASQGNPLNVSVPPTSLLANGNRDRNSSASSDDPNIKISQRSLDQALKMVSNGTLKESLQFFMQALTFDPSNIYALKNMLAVGHRLGEGIKGEVSISIKSIIGKAVGSETKAYLEELYGFLKKPEELVFLISAAEKAMECQGLETSARELCKIAGQNYCRASNECQPNSKILLRILNVLDLSENPEDIQENYKWAQLFERTFPSFLEIDFVFRQTIKNISAKASQDNIQRQRASAEVTTSDSNAYDDGAAKYRSMYQAFKRDPQDGNKLNELVTFVKSSNSKDRNQILCKLFSLAFEATGEKKYLAEHNRYKVASLEQERARAWDELQKDPENEDLQKKYRGITEDQRTLNQVLLEITLELDTNNFSALIQLAQIYGEIGQSDMQKSLLEEVLSRSTNQPGGLDKARICQDLGKLRLETGEFLEADYLFQLGIEAIERSREPEFAVVRYNLTISKIKALIGIAKEENDLDKAREARTILVPISAVSSSDPVIDDLKLQIKTVLKPDKTA